MRILHISSAKTFGGGEKHLVELCRGLTERGHEVYLALRPTNQWQDRVDFIPKERILHVTLRNSFGMFSAKRISRFVKRNGIQIIHAHLARDYVPASIAARLSGDIPFVLTRHVLFRLKSFYRFALRNLSRAIAVSAAVESSLKDLFPPNKVVRISNGIDVDARAAADRVLLGERFRDDYDLPHDVPLIGIVGELTELKGQRDFILAADLIAKNQPSARFVVVGRDNTVGAVKRRELRHMADVLGLGEKILFLEWVDETAPLLAALDVLVSASYSESFGLAILEAMAGGTAVVSTKTEGAGELIEDGVSGLLVPIGDPVAIAGAVSGILFDAERRRSLGVNAKARAVSHFSEDEMTAKTIAVYSELIK